MWRKYIDKNRIEQNKFLRVLYMPKNKMFVILYQVLLSIVFLLMQIRFMRFHNETA
jgi:hypothetical protein